LNSELFYYVTANEDERLALVEFAIISNEKFNARSVPIDLVREVLNIKPEQIQAEYVVKLMHPDSKDILGFYSLRSNPQDYSNKKIELQLLYVNPDHTREGLGDELLKKVIGHAKHLGMQTIHCYSMPESKEFYAKHGASVTSTEKNLFNPEGPEVARMSLNIEDFIGESCKTSIAPRCAV
jgi:N-acetylglutamate synthase-like GNAT family acetyltransferase